MKIINARSQNLNIESLLLPEGQSLCIAGGNRSGIIDLFHLVSGQQTKIQADLLELPQNPGVISFKKQQEIYEAELEKDDTDFLDKIDPGTLARDFLQDIEIHALLIDAFKLTPYLNQGYRQLSTGQSRKLILLSQITKGVSSFVFLAPYDGLDSKSREELDKALFHLHKNKIQIIIFVHNLDDVPSWCTYAAAMAKGRLIHFGLQKKVIDTIEIEIKNSPADFQAVALDLNHNSRPDKPSTDQTRLLSLKNGFAGYGGKNIFENLSITIHKGEHTLVTGPNGCGKSTLLQMITGDHPACYQNDLNIFEFQRGSGESIWDIKKQMGIVSAELHRNYYIPGSTLSCILSGLFDSIGLYRSCSPGQEAKAEIWLDRLGMETFSSTPFRELSYANQRLVLIARALIKTPRLLILDEPTQGLDEANRKAVLDFLEDVARLNISTLLYVSHRTDEFRNFFFQHIQM